MEVLVAMLALSCLIALAWSSKKRIGYAWGFFFLFFFGLIIGCILIAASPWNKNIEKNMGKGFYKLDKVIATLFIILSLAAVLNTFYSYVEYGLNVESFKEKLYWDFFLIFGFGGASFYFLTRQKRHQYNTLR